MVCSSFIWLLCIKYLLIMAGIILDAKGQSIKEQILEV